MTQLVNEYLIKTKLNLRSVCMENHFIIDVRSRQIKKRIEKLQAKCNVYGQGHSLPIPETLKLPSSCVKMLVRYLNSSLLYRLNTLRSDENVFSGQFRKVTVIFVKLGDISVTSLKRIFTAFLLFLRALFRNEGSRGGGSLYNGGVLAATNRLL